MQPDPRMIGRLSRALMRTRERGPLGPLTALSSAFALATLLAIPVNRLVIWSGAGVSAERGLTWVRSVVASCWQDALVLLVLTVLHLTLRLRVKATTARRTIEALFATLYAILATVNALNSISMRSVGSLFDASWLVYFRLFNLTTALPPVVAALQPLKIVLLIVLAAGLPALAFIAARAIDLRLRTVVEWSLGLFLISMALLLTAPVAADPSNAKRRSLNPLAHRLILSLFPSGGERALLGDVAAFDKAVALDDPDWKLQQSVRSASSCCSGSNLVLITLDTVPLKRVTPRFVAQNAARYPNLAWLYSNGRFFDNFYTNYPTSAPAFATLLSSTYPTNSLFRFSTEELAGRSMPTLANVMLGQRYRTAHFMSGELRFASADRYVIDRGFEQIEDSTTLRCRPTDNITFSQYAQLGDDCTAAAAARWLGDRQSQPFFLWLWLSNAHAPYFTRAHALRPVARPGLNEFYQALAESDAALGVILGKLRATGQLADTVIMVTADHGEAFGEHGLTNHGGSVFDEQVRVPFVLVTPHGRRGLVDHRVGSLVDVTPTALDLLGVQSASLWQGRSVFAADHPRRAYFVTARGGRSGGYREGRYKFVLTDLDAAPVAYDLVDDPAELRPLKLAPAIAERVLARIAAFVAYRATLRWPSRRNPRNPVAEHAIR